MPRIELPLVAAAIIRELLLNSNEPLLSAFEPGCKKNGMFSSMSVIRDNISRAVAPLFARIATVFSGWKSAYQRRYAHAEIDFPDCRQARTILYRCSLKCSNICF